MDSEGRSGFIVGSMEASDAQGIQERDFRRHAPVSKGFRRDDRPSESPPATPPPGPGNWLTARGGETRGGSVDVTRLWHPAGKISQGRSRARKTGVPLSRCLEANGRRREEELPFLDRSHAAQKSTALSGSRVPTTEPERAFDQQGHRPLNSAKNQNSLANLPEQLCHDRPQRLRGS